MLDPSANTTLAQTSALHSTRGSLVIPEFDIHGVLPPIRPGELAQSLDRSPYSVDMLTFARRFASSQERCQILAGLLELRRLIRGLGLAEGFQWVNGSFTENVEVIRGRAPKDIDVVTLAAFGNEESQRRFYGLLPELFNPGLAKSRFHVDHYVLNLSLPAGEAVTRSIAYWSSMWSHQRDTNRWKGFVSIPVDSNDTAAEQWLADQTWEAGAAP